MSTPPVDPLPASPPEPQFAPQPASFRRFAVEGRDLDEAREFFSDGYNGSGFHLERSGGEFSYRHTVAGDDEMTLRTSTVVGTVIGTVQPKDEYIVSWISSGVGVMDIGADETSLVFGRPAMFPTGKRYAFHFSDVHQNLVQFDARFLERIAAERNGAAPGPLHFHHAVVPDNDQLARWKATISGVARTVLGGSGERPANDLLRSEANRIAARALLETFAHEAPRSAVLFTLPPHAKLRAAIDFMHAHPDRPISATDIAEAAGLSLRGLQHVFSQQLETTPTEYLRGIRLDHVHAELTAQSPGETTVSAVARRWGFAHAGRFAGSYLRRFGEYPAATLGG